MGITPIDDQASGLRRLFSPLGGSAQGWPVVHAFCCPARPAVAAPLVQSLVHAWADQGQCLAWVDELDYARREQWPWPCPVRYDLGQSLLGHVPLSASMRALDERVWFASARQMQEVGSQRSWPLSRRLLDSGVVFDAVCISVEPQSLRAWSAYGLGIHHTVVVDNQAAEVQAALDWMARVPSASVASWRLLVTDPEPVQADELDALVQAAAALLGQPVQLLGPVAAQWKGGSLSQALPGLERLRRVLVDRIVLN